MDILKELFGTCDELQIIKSLFGSGSGSRRIPEHGARYATWAIPLNNHTPPAEDY